MEESAKRSGRRVLISGAGIAGLTAAYWLHRQGWEVVLLEKADSLRKGEYVIDFAGTGWDVASQMGLSEELKRCHLPIETMVFRNGQGSEKARVSMDNLIRSMGVEDKYAALNRCDLEELLYDLVKADVEVRFQASIQSLEEHDNGISVVFDDGRAESYDLLVGADGLHSNVRGLAFGEESSYARYLGYHVASYRVRGFEFPEKSSFVMMREPNKQAGILQMPGEEDALVYYVFRRDSDAYVPRAKRKEVLTEVFGQMGGVVPQLLARLDDPALSVYMDTTTQIEMPSWHKQRVVLIGDAAYCLTLISGQGASMAMGGAFALGEALAAHDDIPKALAQYERRLRSFIEEMQEKARKFSASFVPGSRLGLWFTELMTKWMGMAWVQRFVAKQFNLQSLFEREMVKRGD